MSILHPSMSTSHVDSVQRCNAANDLEPGWNAHLGGRVDILDTLTDFRTNTITLNKSPEHKPRETRPSLRPVLTRDQGDGVVSRCIGLGCEGGGGRGRLESRGVGSNACGLKGLREVSEVNKYGLKQHAWKLRKALAMVEGEGLASIVTANRWLNK